MLFGKMSSSSSTSSTSLKDVDVSNTINEEQFKEMFPHGYYNTKHINDAKEFWSMDKETFKAHCRPEESQSKLSTWLEWQRRLQPTVNINHSKDTDILTSLLQYSDAKRFNMPASTQNPTFDTQEIPILTQNPLSPIKIKQSTVISSPAKPKLDIVSLPTKAKPQKKKQKILKSPSKKDGDIRALFCTAAKSTKNYAKLVSDLGIQNTESISTQLLNLLIDLNWESNNCSKECYFCSNIFDCSIIEKIRKQKRNQSSLLPLLQEPKLPDIDLIDEMNADSILKCRSLDAEDNEIYINDLDDNNIQNVLSNNFDLEFDFGSPVDIKSPVNLITDTEKDTNIDEKNFDLGDIEDIFADSSPEIIEKDTEIKNDGPKDEKGTLGFFGLDSIDDIFADDDNSTETTSQYIKKLSSSPVKIEISNNNDPINVEYPLSPSILSGRVKPKMTPASPIILVQKSKESTSPILNTQVRKFQLSTKKPVNHVKNVQESTTTNNNDMIIDHNNTPAQKDLPSLNKSKTVAPTNKSMFTITQLVEMINTSDNDTSIKKSSPTKKDSAGIELFDDRSSSPIIFTQADRQMTLNMSNSKKNKLTNSQSTKNKSLIILDSDSDSNDDTQVYEVADKGKPGNVKTDAENSSSLNCKRKLELDDDSITSSPYFSKKQKVDNTNSKTFTLQEKVLAALSSNKIFDNKSCNNDININFVVSAPSFLSQKENKNPLNEIQSKNSDDENEYVRKNKLETLQIFRRDNKNSQKTTCVTNGFRKPELTLKRKISFDDSDDDFVVDDKNRDKSSPMNNRVKSKNTTNHKVRKKKGKANEFLDLEAEISDEDNRVSGDELSDDSVGSIIDFICDDNITHHEDMQALYMRSVKSPVKGTFKIPQLPKKFNTEEVFSQFVEEDTYEMDSFCVDSHIGLTQVNDVSELELAEIVLEERRGRRRNRNRSETEKEDSPVIRRRRNVKRQISSDSDDSS